MKKYINLNLNAGIDSNISSETFLKFGRTLLMWFSLINLTTGVSPITILEAVSHYQTEKSVITQNKEVQKKKNQQNGKFDKEYKKVKKRRKKCN